MMQNAGVALPGILEKGFCRLLISAKIRRNGPSATLSPAPPKPAFPSDKHVKEIERSYIREHRLPQIRLARLVSQTAVEGYIRAELFSFERKDVLTKPYPLGDHVIICEGDSWFNHPFLSDIPDLL